MNKFFNRKVYIGEFKFDSVLESDVFKMLKLLEMAGHIKIIGLQPKIYMTEAKILYKPDFMCHNITLKEIPPGLFYAEAKGFETPVWKLKKRLWLKYTETPLVVYAKNRKGVYLKEIVYSLR